MTSVELFAGGGGAALGVHQAGFRTLAVVEQDAHAIETLRRNASTPWGVDPELDIVPVDVREFNYEELEGLGPVDLLSGGAPCQPFSLGGKHAGQRDERNMFPEVFRAQRALEPKAVLLENVRGLARPAFRPYLEHILLQLALPGLPELEAEGWKDHKERLIRSLISNNFGDAPGYSVWIASVESANYGVPQRRNRLFIIALRHDLGRNWTWPAPTHSRNALLEAKYNGTGVYWHEHGLPGPQNGRPGRPAGPPRGDARWRTVRDALSTVPEPDMDRPHTHHPNHIGIPGARSYPGHTGSPWDEPAKTLKAGVHGVPGGENMLRKPSGEVRYFTVHEASLLQTFPEDYVFVGSRTQAMRQIGNAAPVKVVRILASALRTRLMESHLDVQSPSLHVDLLNESQLTQL